MDNLVPKKTPDPLRAPRLFVQSVAALLFTVTLAACASSPPAVSTTPSSKAPTGALHVLVRPPDRTIEPIAITEPGALPVQSGGAMSIDVDLDQPAFIYLVWINSEGQILPLYPWNNEMLEIQDIQQVPPVRRATKRIFSPLLGRSWTFSDKPGVETVILLTRRSALPTDVYLASLLKSPPTANLENRASLAEVRIPNQESANDQSALTSFLEPLSKHFDLIEAVQFAHEDEQSK